MYLRIFSNDMKFINDYGRNFLKGKYFKKKRTQTRQNLFDKEKKNKERNFCTVKNEKLY